jgi:hypothetical protein
MPLATGSVITIPDLRFAERVSRWVAFDRPGAANTAATATRAGTVNVRQFLRTITATYDVAGSSGLLTVTLGTATMEFYVITSLHMFLGRGLSTDNVGQSITATLAAVAGARGSVVITGYFATETTAGV